MSSEYHVVDALQAVEPAYHIPVMLEEALEGLALRPEGTYVDVTFGGGGHSRAILERLGEGGRLLAFDQDEDAARQVDSGEWIVGSTRAQMLSTTIIFISSGNSLAPPVNSLGSAFRSFESG